TVLLPPPPPQTTLLFPYTTLFRSGKACRRRRTARCDEGERAWHARDARIHHRDTDLSALSGATRERAAADAESDSDNHPSQKRGTRINQSGIDRRMGISPARNRTSEAHA